MCPAFDNTRKNFCIPFGSHIVSTLPCEDILVRDSSFADRFVEGIYLHVVLTGHVIHMFDMYWKQEIVLTQWTH